MLRLRTLRLCVMVILRLIVCCLSVICGLLGLGLLRLRLLVVLSLCRRRDVVYVFRLLIPLVLRMIDDVGSYCVRCGDVGCCVGVGVVVVVADVGGLVRCVVLRV